MKSWKHILPVAGTLLLLTGVAAPAVYADYSDVEVETYSTKEKCDQVNLAVHTSYLTDYYDTIIHLESEDKNIAVASADSEGHILISAVGSGYTNISFWYKYSYYDKDDDWTLVTIPVKVSGQVGNASAVTSTNDGLFFPSLNVKVASGETYTMSELRLNGNRVEATELVWMTTEQQVITVEQSTGLITALNLGTAALYAVTKDGSYSGCITVTVTEF